MAHEKIATVWVKRQRYAYVVTGGAPVKAGFDICDVEITADLEKLAAQAAPRAMKRRTRTFSAHNGALKFKVSNLRHLPEKPTTTGEPE